MSEQLWENKLQGIPMVENLGPMEITPMPEVEFIPPIELQITTALFARAISRPVPVNDPDQALDYEQIAKDCHERAKEAAPYLLRELGLLPKEEA